MSIMPVKGLLTGKGSHPIVKKAQGSDTEFSELLKGENKSMPEKSKANLNEVKKAKTVEFKEKPMPKESKDMNAEVKMENTAKNFAVKENNSLGQSTVEKVEESVASPLVKDEKKETLEALYELLNQFIADLSLKIGVDETEIREFIGSTEISGSELLDINTWKKFVVEINQLFETSEILTNDKAFSELGMISNALETMMNTGEMRQLTAGMTEGGKEWNTFMEEVKGMILDLKNSDGEEMTSLEVEGEMIENGILGKVEEMPFSAVMEGENSTFHQQENLSEKEGVSSKRLENPLTNGNRLFDHLLTGIKELEGSSRLPEGVTVREILSQVTSQIKTLQAPDRTTLELMLQPATLGKVLIHVTSKNGVMQAELRVENEAARVALENNIADLKTSFENQGFKIQEVEVMLSESGIGSNDSEKNGEQDQKKNKNRGNRKIELETESMMNEREETIAIHSPEGQGSSVDYSA